MRLLIAPDSFAGTLSAVQSAHAIASGWRSHAPDDQTIERPMSDGGPGFVGVIAKALGAQLVETSVTGPLGDEVPAEFAVHGSTAYVEAAQACGLALVPPGQRNPEDTTSYGVGQLLKAALAEGVERIVIGLGGTATNDAGAGMLAALGATADGALDCGPRQFARLREIDLGVPRRLFADVDLVVATDVDNPLLGLRGASRSFGPQKGASEEQVMRLEGALEHFHETVGKLPDGKDPAVALGAGAAGGLGYALMMLGATRVPGIATVMDIVGLADLIEQADLVITGEGCFDWQSLRGKVVSGVAAMALNDAKPCVVLAGQVMVGRREYTATGVAAAYSVSDIAGGVEESMADPAGALAAAAARVAKTWSAGRRRSQRERGTAPDGE
ncbi:MAG: glycerate kinase [Actinobacteria bacterium]|nr:glycerate kinase [Actinomycetota bacterium]MCB9412235.1 glycerate kinase [Actinomycetota bacterium]